ncbi:DNA-binding protein [Paenibacillus harenae]|uniref:DNA-directed RNA polymerase alpha subunit n=1 Tax=Paenibacillus harenae TaxID=306543 RepID=A0ABT9TZ28_PAEHA|nr:DNA-binding protein [Paenibacillus harenae]MDQ0059162.1 DNA-directed RNA polymerase alpha subunit [Paenibacillus harenae]MDQ0112624.1 DNA-directed RNA polymerase alpha subunit [Paenibacillus harenae]
MDPLNKPTEQSDLPKISSPATRALTAAGYFRLQQFTKVTEADLLKLHGVGPKGIRILKEALKERGLSFAQK